MIKIYNYLLIVKMYRIVMQKIDRTLELSLF
jgi:hypothetical protein